MFKLGVRHVSRNIISLYERKLHNAWKEYILGNIRKSIDYKRLLGPSAETLVKEVNLVDKTCLITGASGSIGLEITRCLSYRDCRILMACRNIYKARLAVSNTCERKHNIFYYQMDLASLASVKSGAANILKNEKKIDIIILNAATFGLPWTLTEDGLETIFQVNFLSQYFLLLCLEPILAPDVRVVFVSSESHRNFYWTKTFLTLDDISLPSNEYTSIKSYNISKICGLLLMHYLSYQWSNTKRTVFCAHPGSFIKTGLCRNWWAYEVLYTLILPFSKTIAQGASTIVYCAISPELEGITAAYFNNCKRCDESDIAKDLGTAFKIHNLISEILRDRVSNLERLIKNLSEIKNDVKST